MTVRPQQKESTMQSRGLLMIEHRLIERMISVIDEALEEIRSTRSVNLFFVDTAVDFIRTYGDRVHHGKEENILFRELDKRLLSTEHRRILNELTQEHVFGRRTTTGIAEANTRYRNGDTDAFADVASGLKTIVEFYPKHIAKEDRIFFPAAQTYFSDQEDEKMLAEFQEFDRKMIHEKYRGIVEGLEKTR